MGEFLVQGLSLDLVSIHPSIPASLIRREPLQVRDACADLFLTPPVALRRLFVLGIGFFSLCFLMTSLGGQFSARRPGDSPFTIRTEGNLAGKGGWERGAGVGGQRRGKALSPTLREAFRRPCQAASLVDVWMEGPYTLLWLLSWLWSSGFF